MSFVGGKRSNYTKNHRSREDWMEGKKFGRPKQVWVWDDELDDMPVIATMDGKRKGRWEKESNGN